MSGKPRGRPRKNALVMPSLPGIAGAAGAMSAPVTKMLAKELPPVMSVEELPVVPSPSVRGAGLKSPEARAKAAATRATNAAGRKAAMAKAAAEYDAANKKPRRRVADAMSNRMARYDIAGKKYTDEMRAEFIERGGDEAYIMPKRKARARKAVDEEMRAMDRAAKRSARGVNKAHVNSLLRAEKRDVINKLVSKIRNIQGDISMARNDIKEKRVELAYYEAALRDTRETLKGVRKLPLSDFDDMANFGKHSEISYASDSDAAYADF
jgi:hypothetical protein